MVKNIDSSGLKIFAIAIAVSIIVHIFWISAVKIVTNPSREGRVKFSKVSFLGPASGTGGVSEFKMAAQSASFLEKRYRQKIVNMTVSGAGGINISYGKVDEKYAPAHRDDNAIAPLIEEALNNF